MGTRQNSAIPIKKHNEGRISTISKNTQVHQGLLLAAGSATNNNLPPPQLTDPLTPLHRLRKFQKIRDKNLRKVVLKKKFNKKMSVDVEKEHTNNENKKEIKKTNNKEKNEKITNGEQQQNGEQKDESNKKCDVEKCPVEVIENNGEVIGDGGGDMIIHEIPQVNTGKKNESNKSDPNKKVEKKIITKDEKKEIISEKCEEEIKNVIDNVEDSEADEQILNVDGECDLENEDKSVYEDSDNGNEDIKILRRSFREEITSGHNFITSQPSTSKQSPLLLLDSQEKLKKSSSMKDESSSSSRKLTAETRHFLRSNSRIEGRRSYRHDYRKRKSEDNLEGESIYEKRKMRNTSICTPSILSPGWKFFSSPLNKFWTPKAAPPFISSTSSPGIYGRATYKTTPYSVCNELDPDDSMAVNYDDKSLFAIDPDLSADSPPTRSTSSILPSWGCNIM